MTKMLSGDSGKALFYCGLLAFQFGLQPMIATRFTASTISRTSVVIGTEIGKIVIAIVAILAEPSAVRTKIFEEWSISNSLKIAALPATLYAIQNLFVQYGYIWLDSMTFNLLNQTKTLAAAFWLWMIMGQPQSYVQMVALFLLLIAAYILNTGAGSSPNSAVGFDPVTYHWGVLMVMGASMISGLSAALTQRALVGSRPRHALFFSAELAVYGILFLVGKILFSPKESDLIYSGTLFTDWSFWTLIPVLTNAAGGMVVGLVTKYAGGVVKGFALIAGLIITGFAQWIFENKALGPKDWVAIVLVSASIYLHANFPPPKKSSVAAISDKKKN